ncbi:hypothetical protein ASG87_08130 [Frateuria sp. Soil773]|uniref:DUF4097 family beta strand repeat-containing protein n=1 Tax=Frateuria sp. Soil773 TaxID=1736407 RepID=UPI0006F23AB2|nr:DUF4097 family beta strand repeat-containing protein [Frateuria sp. Soil773]KRE88543.1 hypothetical protein ASG87_08130 [Frateuria sp. Soil773]
MRRITALLVLLAPLAAYAGDNCRYEAPRNLKADLAGVRSVQFEVNGYDLHVTGSNGARGLELTGRACASSQEVLDSLTVTQQREGDRLVITLGGNRHFSFSLFGSMHADLDVNASLPANLPVSVEVGSGDANVTGVAALESHVGSGDLHVRGIAGRFSTSVGSGDVEANDLGSLEVGSVGSGDLKARGIRGDARVGSIGSGDVDLNDVGGSVHADTIGSGDLTVNDVGGDFHLGAKGSGDVSYNGVKGKVSVPRDDD